MRNHFTVKNTAGNTNRFSVDTGNGNTVVGGTCKSVRTTLSSTLSGQHTYREWCDDVEGQQKQKSFYSKEYRCNNPFSVDTGNGNTAAGNSQVSSGTTLVAHCLAAHLSAMATTLATLTVNGATTLKGATEAEMILQ